MMKKKNEPSRLSRLMRRLARLQILVALALTVLFAVFSYQILSVLYRAIGHLIGRIEDKVAADMATNLVSQVACTLLGLLMGILLGGYLEKMQRKWSSLHVGDKLSIFVGCGFGIIVSIPFLFMLSSPGMRIGVYAVPLMIAVVVGMCWLATLAVKSLDEIFPWNRFNFRGKKSGIKLLDTNVIIDGRIYDVVRTGFIEGQLYIPGFVLEELQHIADSADPLRRQRGRRGLEVLRHLKAEYPVETQIHDKVVQGVQEVDARLVRLARFLGADIITNDFNLNRVAELQDVKVLNINDLALALRPNVLPKETLVLPISREGNQAGQGVGYLEDGTMVVVDNGKHYIGETIEVVVTQVIQTERGKMIFAEVADRNNHAPEVSTRRKPSARRPY